MDQLRCVLDNDVLKVKKMISENASLFPEYTGLKPQGAVARCIASKDAEWLDSGGIPPAGLTWQKCSYGPETNEIKWASIFDKKAVYVWVSDITGSDRNTSLQAITNLQIKLEPQRLYPARHFVYDLGNEQTDNELVQVGTEPGISYVGVCIPFEKIGLSTNNLHPVRIDVRVQKEKGEPNSWRPNNPITSRLILGTDNPADLGWLVFDNTETFE